MNDKKTQWCRGGRREAILSVAREVFSQEGYGAASMSHIAARLGGSKGTLYNYFRSKEELFEADIQDRCSSYAQSIFGPTPDSGDVREILTALADRILNLALSDESTAFYTLVVSEAQRAPAIGRAFYESGPRNCIERVAAVLDRARADGQIVTDDCTQAAQDFLSLIHGGLHFKRILNVIDRPSAKEMSTEAARMVDVFLRAYGSKAAPSR
jgi:AcrR family transcriptional regulator